MIMNDNNINTNDNDKLVMIDNLYESEYMNMGIV